MLHTTRLFFVTTVCIAICVLFLQLPEQNTLVILNCCHVASSLSHWHFRLSFQEMLFGGLLEGIRNSNLYNKALSLY